MASLVLRPGMRLAAYCPNQEAALDTMKNLLGSEEFEFKDGVTTHIAPYDWDLHGFMLREVNEEISGFLLENHKLYDVLLFVENDPRAYARSGFFILNTH